MNRPIGFFVHHQGRGHAKRCAAIMDHLGDRPITILTADRSIFEAPDERMAFVDLPNAIGDPSATRALHDQPTPSTMHCVPVGSPKLRQNAGMIARFLTEENPSLFFVDVSAEWTLLSRLCSVPAVKVRMHGDRNDPGHMSAYEAAAGMVAPFDVAIEQDDYPDWARAKTFYSGGLCTTTQPVPTKEEARRRLGLSQDHHIALTISGGGGHGTLYAPLTMAARALPDTLWLTIGPVHREGHETEFANLQNLGWVANTIDHIAAADVVLASAGDNTVHEIARVGRPFLCVPEWRYFDEQGCKAAVLTKVGAAHCLPHWPGSNRAWVEAIDAAETIDTERQRALFSADAAANIAGYLQDLEERLWGEEGPVRPTKPRLVA